jgi:hypothetical protein
MTMTAKFALVARDASSAPMETSMEGGMMAIVGVGKGAKAVVTKAPKPFAPQKMMGGAAPPEGHTKRPKK